MGRNDEAVVQAGMGYADAAFAALQPAFDECSYLLVEYLNTDERLEKLHTDSRLDDLRKRTGLPDIRKQRAATTHSLSRNDVRTYPIFQAANVSDLHPREGRCPIRKAHV
jgi:hypothetical protein